MMGQDFDPRPRSRAEWARPVRPAILLPGGYARSFLTNLGMPNWCN